MKTSSEYQLENPMHKVMQVCGEMNFNTSFLKNISTSILNKLTNVSPFLLLLVPVFMMMAITLFSGTSNVNENKASIPSVQQTEIARITPQIVK